MPEFKGNVVAVRTGKYWDKPLEEIADKFGQVGSMARALRNKSKGSPNEDGKMTPKQQKEFMAEYRKKIISAKDEETWKRGASNSGYHYMGCAKTMALIGQAFAEAIVGMEKK